MRKLYYFGADVGELTSAGYPKLAHEADAADAAGAAARPFSTLESRVEAPPEPIDEAVFDGVFPPAWDVPEARAYLEGRGVGEDTAISLGLGWDATQRRVVFPVRDRGGGLFGFTGRAVDPDAKPKIRDYYGLPKRHLILGEERWRGEPWDNRPLVLVEGLFGYAHMVEMGLEAYADVGALLGSVLTEYKAARVRMRAARTYLLMDNDRAGDVCLFGPEDAEGNFDSDSGAVAMLMRDAPIYVPVWPEGKDDPDQLTRREVWAMLRNTPRFQDGG